jgi:hypothetical protein
VIDTYLCMSDGSYAPQIFCERWKRSGLRKMGPA